MIRHSVIFKIKDKISSHEKKEFFEAVNKLSDIPNVHKFEFLKQISSKNKFEYGISMEFKNQEHYDIYSEHNQHQSFIQNFWIKSVEDFLEIDYVKIS
jgi:Stress responsive A/B Barrel Domain